MKLPELMIAMSAVMIVQGWVLLYALSRITKLQREIQQLRDQLLRYLESELQRQNRIIQRAENQ